MASYHFFQPEISKNYGTMEWREDIKSVMKKAGAEGKPTTFLIADSQIKQVSEHYHGCLTRFLVVGFQSICIRMTLHQYRYYLLYTANIL